MGKILKTVMITGIFLFCGMFILRIILSDYWPAEAKEIYANSVLDAAYSENGENNWTDDKNNPTSRYIAEKGYDATSIEDITATVGVAKGTLYYHFSSKEEIFNFLIEEGIKLLQNSVDIKTAKRANYIDKIKAIVLIQIKIVAKYEDIITIILGQFWGNEERHKKCQNLVYEYIGQIEKIVQQGIEKGEIKKGDTRAIASEIYGLICSTLVFKKREEMDIMKLYQEYENTVINGLRIK